MVVVVGLVGVADSKRLLTGAADKTARLWEVETGRELAQWGHDATIRCVSFAHGNERFCAVTDKEMKRNSTICVYQLVDLGMLAVSIV